MKRLFLIANTLLFLSLPVYAGEFADLKAKIGEVRNTAITMLNDSNKRGESYQKAAKESDKAVVEAIAKMKVVPAKKEKFQELQAIWLEFKKTREEQVIPFLLAGKQAEAEKLAAGIQKERLLKMFALCDELDK